MHFRNLADFGWLEIPQEVFLPLRWTSFVVLIHLYHQENTLISNSIKVKPQLANDSNLIKCLHLWILLLIGVMLNELFIVSLILFLFSFPLLSFVTEVSFLLVLPEFLLLGLKIFRFHFIVKIIIKIMFELNFLWLITINKSNHIFN